MFEKVQFVKTFTITLRISVCTFVSFQLKFHRKTFKWKSLSTKHSRQNIPAKMFPLKCSRQNIPAKLSRQNKIFALFFPPNFSSPKEQIHFPSKKLIRFGLRWYRSGFKLFIYYFLKILFPTRFSFTHRKFWLERLNLIEVFLAP